jgi:hypothetical protein
MVFVALLIGNKLQKPDQVLLTISNPRFGNNFFLNTGGQGYIGGAG